MKGGKSMNFLSLMLATGLLLTACAGAPSQEEAPETSIEVPLAQYAPIQPEASSAAPVQTGLIAEQLLDGADGQIHYSYHLPENYDESREYPMMVVMPGYDMMWFGEDSSGSNLNWQGFLAWTELDEDLIVVSAQLTDWGEKSARQAIELTEYFLQNFAVDESRVYAAGYSAGGETMSQTVSMRPDLYAAYLHGASQWDGTYAPIAENQTAVYIYMAENDEYYGSQKARDAYNNLLAAYRETGLSDSEIDQLLQVEIPDDDFFNQQGIYNYHGGANVVFDDETILNWIISKQKPVSESEAEFSDVAADAWYAGAVKYVRENGLMTGTSDTSFSPNANISRAMLATILYRMAGSPTELEIASYSDVADRAYYTDAVNWAAAEGIMAGYGNGRFGPNDPVTREQIVTILWRYTGSPSSEAGQDFADKNTISSYAVDAVNWARASGIVNGKDGNRFDPQGNLSRAEAAVILKNYLQMQ